MEQFSHCIKCEETLRVSEEEPRTPVCSNALQSMANAEAAAADVGEWWWRTCINTQSGVGGGGGGAGEQWTP